MWFVPALIVIALGAWAFASPIGSSPDDDFHLTSIWCANSARVDLCAPGPGADTRSVPPAVVLAPCFAHNPEVSAACQAKSLAEGSEPTMLTARGSFENNYPPVFYAVMNVLAGPDLQISALLMRFLTILLFAGMTVAMYILLPRGLRAPLVWGWLITMVPLGLFLLASNNPSSWAIIGVGSLWLALVGYFQSVGRRRIGLGVIAAVAAVMAAGSRGDAAIYVVMAVAIAYFLTLRRGRQRLLPLVLPAVLVVLAVLFFLTSRQSTVAVSGLSDGSYPNDLSPFAALAYNLLNVPQLWAGIFGSWNLGWLDTSMPAIVSVGGLAVFAGVVFVALGTRSWRKTVAVLALAVVLWLLPTYVLGAGSNVVGQNVQPRYLLPLIIVLAGVALLPAVGREFTLSRFQRVLVGATLAVAQSVALEINIRRYITGVDVAGVNLDDGAEWWWSSFPFSPMAIWIIGSIAFAALVTILVREMAQPHELH